MDAATHAALFNSNQANLELDRSRGLEFHPVILALTLPSTQEVWAVKQATFAQVVAEQKARRANR
jgi:hypothetical protein